jgi:hypothetical protein
LIVMEIGGLPEGVWAGEMEERRGRKKKKKE